jgi:AraC-like DNA-binding protein
MPVIILRIKNMVCPRCSKVVKEELDKLGYTTTVERLGLARIEYSENHPDMNEITQILLSDYLVQKLNHDYSFLSTLFSSVESITVEKYFILQKIERVKELLIYDELTLSEIAYRLGYSNVQYLSNQFKKVTGMSPSQFKSIRGRARNSIDKISSD